MRGGDGGSDGALPWWAYQTLVELSVPALYASCARLLGAAATFRELRRTRARVREAAEAGGGEDALGLRHLLSPRDGDGPSGGGGGLCVGRGVVAPSPSGASADPEAVIRLSTREVCWKHFSAKHLTGRSRVTYQIDEWHLAMQPFRLVDPRDAGVSVRVPRLRASEAEDVLRKVDLSLLRAEREAVDLSWTQRIYNALVRGRYASHAERNRRALLRGTEVTVFGRATTDESGESGGPGVCVRPDRSSSFFITERTVGEVLEDLDQSILESALTMATLGLVSTFFAGVLSVYVYVVARDLYRSLGRGKGRCRGRATWGDPREEVTSGEEDDDEEELGDGAGNKVCCICLSRKKRYVMVPCGHCCACRLCAIALFTEAEEKNVEPKCPICRREVDHFIKMYNT